MVAAEGRLHEVESLIDGGICRVNDANEVCLYRPVRWYGTLVYQSEVCCVFAVNVCLSSKRRSVFGWHECNLTYTYVPYIWRILFVIDTVNSKWCTV